RGAADAQTRGDLLELGKHHAVQVGAGACAGAGAAASAASAVGLGVVCVAGRAVRGPVAGTACGLGDRLVSRSRVDDVCGRVAQDAFLKEAGFERAPRSSGGGLSHRWTTRGLPRDTAYRRGFAGAPARRAPGASP